MQIGPLRCRISIQKQTTVQDSTGQPVNTWNEVYKAWANITQTTGIPGKETIMPSGFISEVPYIITIRFPSVTVNSTMRVVYRKRIFMIQTVSSPKEERKQMDLLCKEENT